MNPFALAFGIALLSLPALAQQTGFEADAAVRVAGVSTGSALNVRAGAGTGNPVVATLPADEAGLTVLECSESGAWCRIATARGPLGWVSARYLAPADTDAAPAAPLPDPEPRFSEAERLARVTGIAVAPGATVTVPELPPYLIGTWDDDDCADDDGTSRVTVLENGLRVGAATARFKSAIFRGGGYDLITLLIQERDVMNAVPQRALYRLEPGEDTLALSGDVLTTRILRRCSGP